MIWKYVLLNPFLLLLHDFVFVKIFFSAKWLSCDENDCFVSAERPVDIEVLTPPPSSDSETDLSDQEVPSEQEIIEVSYPPNRSMWFVKLNIITCITVHSREKY